MAHILAHIMVTELACLEKYGQTEGMERFLELMLPCILPDTIRCMLPNKENNRRFSHFCYTEAGENSMLFPREVELKHLTEKDVEKRIIHNTPYKHIALDSPTSVKSFFQVNFGSDISANEYRGILLHLVQDEIYGGHIRNLIDCRRQDEGIFCFRGKVYNPKEVRKLIDEFQEGEIYTLKWNLRRHYGIDFDEQLEEMIIPRIREAYNEKMTQTTIKYLRTKGDRWNYPEEAIVVVVKMTNTTKVLL